jgi:hypothetical protein
MRWPDWLNPRQKAINSDASVDLGRVETGGHVAASQTMRALRTERKNLVRRRKSIEKKFKRLTKLDAYRLTRSSRFSVDMQVYQLSEAIRDSNSADQAGAALKEQIAAIEKRIQDIDQEVARLRSSAR